VADREDRLAKPEGIGGVDVALDNITNYGERYRNGERTGTGFVESAVNQVISKRMAKKQQMQWSRRGAHLLLQIRTEVLYELVFDITAA
jgi:hypothetical protein